MDLGGENEKFGFEKRSDNPLSYPSVSMSPDWQFSSGNPSANQQMGLVHTDNSIPHSNGDLMRSSFCPTIWDHPNSQNSAGERSPMFLQTGAGILSQGLPNIPADSAFIERAARFSCFNGGNFSEMLNSFSLPEALNPYSKGGVGSIQGTPAEVLLDSSMKPLLGSQSPKNDRDTKDASVSVEGGRAIEGSPINNKRKGGSFVGSSDEERRRIGASNIASDESEYSGGGAGKGPISSKGPGGKKRKKGGQDNERDKGNGGAPHQSHGEPARGSSENKQKGDDNPNCTSKATKGGKDASQASDPPKEDYIHVRARRGQATNSHSLAERVRREKISERMKFLQDLVPGCSKVTGKAVMLDEIINYVQSLQKQVEHLSMKLATVNPQMDPNYERLIPKDVLSRVGPLSTLGYIPDMTMVHPQLHPSQQGLVQVGASGMGSNSDGLRRTINSQLMAMSGGGYKEPTSEITNIWDDELNNVIQMSFGANASFNGQDLNGPPPPPPGNMKVEL
ncbi:hypothetical protein GIB67_001758 [Kingdonia uniflora]|uniref:BHLH domain-containing protein n=1 Tax=Kingdonia uniflora TaxID=39325 RepID=A0A7J7LBI5_9MAGN|nr:hypothetical protein GIB67_001758 [Kingdonia uniflora]